MAIHYKQKGEALTTLSCKAAPSFIFHTSLHQKTPKGLQSKYALPKVLSLMGLSMLALLTCGYAELGFALEEADKVRELTGLTAETSKIVKNGCYIAGSASALVGAIWAVASQSLKVAASSAAITIIALKSAGFFAGTLFI